MEISTQFLIIKSTSTHSNRVKSNAPNVKNSEKTKKLSGIIKIGVLGILPKTCLDPPKISKNEIPLNYYFVITPIATYHISSSDQQF